MKDCTAFVVTETFRPDKNMEPTGHKVVLEYLSSIRRVFAFPLPSLLSR